VPSTDRTAKARKQLEQVHETLGVHTDEPGLTVASTAASSQSTSPTPTKRGSTARGTCSCA
jgi:hypothetical protein